VPQRDEVARTLAVAAGLAELLAERVREAEAIGAGDDAVATRLLRERLLRLRPQDGHLLALVAWFAATHDVPAALAAARADHPGRPAE
jgi:hypothetical protein